ncbi:hypothetical protein ACFOY4_09880 [Actinomadura syzygii]|uniref:Ig-like domain-containing protein n=1 Tax=Actinomadura syzygii TaxID=1427538 RepID=A0A5D0UCV6_9ACTN|nr:hypothetical protein [Actinomadura syzygii]TYC15874.1 hypothetical protein FXF65_11070 [Actinomadura syzygii]
MLLTAVLGGLLSGASAAHASDPVCRPSLLGTPNVICTVPSDTDGLRIDFITWTKNDSDLREFDDIRQINLSCTPGETFVIGVTVGFIEEVDQNTGSTPVTCPGSRPPAALRIESGECSRDQNGPGFTCHARWAGGVDPATASWQVTTRRPAPYVITDAGARVTEAHFSCNYNQAESDYRTTLTVRDAVGAQASWSAYVCAW